MADLKYLEEGEIGLKMVARLKSQWMEIILLKTNVALHITLSGLAKVGLRSKKD
jgi:hypothetical protein